MPRKHLEDSPPAPAPSHHLRAGHFWVVNPSEPRGAPPSPSEPGGQSFLTAVVFHVNFFPSPKLGGAQRGSGWSEGLTEGLGGIGNPEMDSSL